MPTISSSNTYTATTQNYKDMYEEYKRVRGSVAVEKDSLGIIETSGQICDKFGVHESLPFIHQLYSENELSFIANVGILQQPVLEKSKYQELNKMTSLFSRVFCQILDHTEEKAMKSLELKTKKCDQIPR